MAKKVAGKMVVIIYGPPGSGKGTQAKLLADKLNLFHFDTGDYLRNLFYGGGKLTKEIQREKKLNEEGKFSTPSWILKIVSQRTKNLAHLGQSIIYSGSPRTLYEAFGDANHQGLYALLEKLYGKKNIHIFILQIPEKESVKRIGYRTSCSVCKTPLLSIKFQGKNLKLPSCPVCGGKIERRRDDRKEILSGRLKDYRNRTEPIFKELSKRKYNIAAINGTLAPYKVYQNILNRIN